MVNTAIHSPNDGFWRDTIDRFKRSQTNLYIGEIVNTQGIDNYLSNQRQSWDVRLGGWNITIRNAKAVKPTHLNGVGDYMNFEIGDIVLCLAINGVLEDLAIIGGINLHGNHEEYLVKGKAPFANTIGPGGNKVKTPTIPYGTAHPIRATQIRGQGTFYGVDNLVDEFISPNDKTTRQDILTHQRQVAGVNFTTPTGDHINYQPGSIVQNAGNLFLVSGGVTNNRCSQLMRHAKRHANIAKFLKVLQSSPVGEIGNIEQLADNIENALLTSDESQFLNVPSESSPNSTENSQSLNVDSNTIISSIVTSQPVSQNREEGDEATGTLNESFLGFSLEEGNKTPSSLSLRIRDHSLLSELLIAQAVECNTWASTQVVEAAKATDANGDLLGNEGSRPQSVNISEPPNQFIGFINDANKGNRTILGTSYLTLDSKANEETSDLGRTYQLNYYNSTEEDDNPEEPKQVYRIVTGLKNNQDDNRLSIGSPIEDGTYNLDTSLVNLPGPTSRVAIKLIPQFETTRSYFITGLELIPSNLDENSETSSEIIGTTGNIEFVSNAEFESFLTLINDEGFPKCLMVEL